MTTFSLKHSLSQLLRETVSLDSNVMLNFSKSAEKAIFPVATASVLLTVAQEAFMQANHAKSSQVTCSVDLEINTLVLQIINNGQGGTPGSEGDAISRIKSHMNQVGGSVEVKKQETHLEGTEVTVKMKIEYTT